MQNTLRPAATALGRLLLTAIFLMAALNKITHFSGVQAYMAAKGMPMTAFFLLGAIVFLVVGGLSVLLGYRAKIGALLLIVFLVPTTLIFHNFWAASPEAAQAEMLNFMKNLGLLGGLLHIAANGSGPGSLDSRLANARN